MTDKHIDDDLSQSAGDPKKDDESKSSPKADDSTKSKAKNNINYYTKQLVSIGHLQLGIVRNLQKEIENIL
jgi:hypothetical protein